MDVIVKKLSDASVGHYFNGGVFGDCVNYEMLYKSLGVDIFHRDVRDYLTNNKTLLYTEIFEKYLDNNPQLNLTSSSLNDVLRNRTINYVMLEVINHLSSTRKMNVLMDFNIELEDLYGYVFENEGEFFTLNKDIYEKVFAYAVSKIESLNYRGQDYSNIFNLSDSFVEYSKQYREYNDSDYDYIGSVLKCMYNFSVGNFDPKESMEYDSKLNYFLSSLDYSAVTPYKFKDIIVDMDKSIPITDMSRLFYKSKYVDDESMLSINIFHDLGIDPFKINKINYSGEEGYKAINPNDCGDFFLLSYNSLPYMTNLSLDSWIVIYVGFLEYEYLFIKRSDGYKYKYDSNLQFSLNSLLAIFGDDNKQMARLLIYVSKYMRCLTFNYLQGGKRSGETMEDYMIRLLKSGIIDDKSNELVYLFIDLILKPLRRSSKCKVFLKEKYCLNIKDCISGYMSVNHNMFILQDIFEDSIKYKLNEKDCLVVDESKQRIEVLLKDDCVDYLTELSSKGRYDIFYYGMDNQDDNYDVLYNLELYSGLYVQEKFLDTLVITLTNYILEYLMVKKKSQDDGGKSFYVMNQYKELNGILKLLDANFYLFHNIIPLSVYYSSQFQIILSKYFKFNLLHSGGDSVFIKVKKFRHLNFIKLQPLLGIGRSEDLLDGCLQNQVDGGVLVSQQDRGQCYMFDRGRYIVFVYG